MRRLCPHCRLPVGSDERVNIIVNITGDIAPIDTLIARLRDWRRSKK
jgi:hypothetical protein